MASSIKRDITHVIFDVDGLILDTEMLYTRAQSEICKDYGKEFTWEIKAQQMGQKEHVVAQMLIDLAGLPITLDVCLPRMQKLLAEQFSSIDLLPGAERLIRHLHKHNIPMCVATGSDRWSYDGKIGTKHKELFSLFLHSVTSDHPEVKHGKPAPDCFLLAAKLFQNPPQPEKTLVFEDSPNGVRAGLAAGMGVVWVPEPRADRSPFADKVDLVLDSLEFFKPELFGLPPFEDSV